MVAPSSNFHRKIPSSRVLAVDLFDLSDPRIRFLDSSLLNDEFINPYIHIYFIYTSTRVEIDRFHDIFARQKNIAPNLLKRNASPLSSRIPFQFEEYWLNSRTTIFNVQSPRTIRDGVKNSSAPTFARAQAG